MANRNTTLASLQSALRRARSARDLRTAVARIVHVSKFRATAAGAANLARVIPLAGIPDLARAKWNARQTALDTFLTWCADQDTWAASIGNATLAWLPAPLWPSRMAVSARRWAAGAGGTDPAILTARFNAAKAAALAKTTNYILPEAIVHPLFATRADGLNPNGAGDPYAFKFRDDRLHELRA